MLAYQRQGALLITGLQWTCQRLNDRCFVLEKRRKRKEKNDVIDFPCGPPENSLTTLSGASILPRSVFACKCKLYSCKKKKTKPSSIFRLSMQSQAVFAWLSNASFKGVVFACKDKLYFPAKKKDVCQRNLCVFACESPAYQRQFDLKGSTPCAMLTVDAEQISLHDQENSLSLVSVATITSSFCLCFFPFWNFLCLDCLTWDTYKRKKRWRHHFFYFQAQTKRSFKRWHVRCKPVMSKAPWRW